MQTPLFISHGSPMIVLDASQARDHLQELGKSWPRPQAIVVISAHWQHRLPLVEHSAQPKTIHDFGPFDPRLFELRYPAPGAPQLAERIASQLTAAGWQSGTLERGLDHGAWTPLLLMFPDADIPVTQLALPQAADAHAAFALGRALASLPHEDVLVIGSGAFTHNLGEVFRRHPDDRNVPDWVREFVDWMRARLEDGDTDALLDYRAQAPFAVRNHPSEEHLLPLFAALGAAGDGANVEPLHESVTYGVLAMDCFAFQPSLAGSTT